METDLSIENYWLGWPFAGYMAVVIFYLISPSVLIGCAPLQEVPSSQALQGAAIGVTATQAVEKAREVLAPVFPLHRPPAELCRPDFTPDGKPDMDGTVTCVAVPCRANSVCETKYDSLEDFFAATPTVVPVHSLGDWLGAASVFCKKHEDLCLQEIGYYEGKRFVIQGP